MMALRKFIIVGLSICCLVAMASIIHATSAVAQAEQPAETKCAGVDLVFLVDESGSMAENDKEGLRVDAVRLAIDSLGDNILYECPDVKHRIAVIGFWDERNGGQDTASYIDSATIAPSVMEFNTWRDARQTLKSKITKPTGAEGATDYLSALKAAADTLAKWRSEGSPDNSIRRQGVVFVTDGGPCVIDRGCVDPPEQYTFNIGEYMQEIENLVDPNGVTFPWHGEDNPDSVRMWFIGFRDKKASRGLDYLSPDNPLGKALRPRWERIVGGHGGTLEVLNSASSNTINRDVSLKVANIVDSITGGKPLKWDCTKPFYVNPYTDKMQVRILKIGSNANVPLEDVKVSLLYQGPLAQGTFAQGNRQGSGGRVTDYRQDGSNEVYVIDSPAPGAWGIAISGADQCRDLAVSFMPMTVSGSIIKPLAQEPISQYDEGDFSDPDAPVMFEYVPHARGVVSQTLTLMSEFPMTVTASIRAGTSHQQDLSLVHQPDNTWHSVQPIKLPVNGVYNWTLTGRALSGDKQNTVEILHDTGVFNVSAVKRFHLETVAPSQGNKLPVNLIENGNQKAVPIKVVARAIEDASGQPLSDRQLQGSNTGSLLTVTLRGAGGSSDPVPMAYNAVARQWEAELVPGQNKVQDTAGQYSTLVELGGDKYDKTAYRPAGPDGRQVETTFERFRIIPVALTALPSSFEQPAYRGKLACVGAQAVPLQVDLALTDSQTGERLKPNDIALEPGSIAAIELVNPAATEKPILETGLWRVEETKDGPVLRASMGITQALPGKFELRIRPNPASLSERYQFLATDTILVPVHRSLNLLQNPRTCTTSRNGLIVLLVLLLAWMIFNFTRRPRGLLELVDAGTGIPYQSMALGRGLRVLLWPVQTVRIHEKGTGLSRLVVRNAKSEGGRAIRLDAYDDANAPLLTGATLASADETYLTQDITAQYN